jgi:hypothetical protein
MNANEPQTLRDEYSWATKILAAEYKQTSENLDDIIKKSENLHVEEQHLFEILLQKYKHLFDGTLGEFNVEPISKSLQFMDPVCKSNHAHAYMVPRSVEKQLQHSNEIVRLMQIGFIEEDFLHDERKIANYICHLGKNISIIRYYCTNLVNIRYRIWSSTRC